MNKTYCFFSARYLPYLGGVERYTYNLANELKAMGNKIIIITSRIGDEPIYEEKDNIFVFRLSSFRLLKGRFPVVKYNKEFRNVLKYISEISIDYIVINTRFYLLSIVGAVFAEKNKIPSIIIEHGTGHFTVNNKVFDFLGHIYEHTVSEIIKRYVKDYYGVSLECNKWLRHFGITAKGVLYNAIDKKQIYELYSRKDMKIEDMIEYNTEDFIITFTGRLIEEKGIMKLVSAFEIVRKQYPNTKLCVAGDGDLYEELLKEHSEGIYILGKLPFGSVISLLRLADIFCLPTDYPEGLPTSVLEAMACRCYVITSASGGAKEVITDSEYGTIVQKNDVDEIKSVLLEMISNKKRREAAIQKSYQRVCSEFTWQRTAAALIQIFER